MTVEPRLNDDPVAPEELEGNGLRSSSKSHDGWRGFMTPSMSMSQSEAACGNDYAGCQRNCPPFQACHSTIIVVD